MRHHFQLPILAAQNATLRGTVTDPSGAVLPGAKITIKNTDKGWTRTTTTNDAGLVFHGVVERYPRIR